MTTLIGTLVGFVLTLFVLSYFFFRDWVLFRWVMALFIGASAGYAAAIALREVLWPMLLRPLLVLRQPLLLLPLLLVLLMLTKAFRGKVSRWGNVAVAYLVGAGAAVAVGGAVLGTLFPQSVATMDAFNFRLMRGRGMSWGEFVITGSLILLGVVTTLAYFHFGARPQPRRSPRRRGWIEALARIGEGFIAVTFGALFAGIFLAAAAALAETAQSLWLFILTLR